VEEWDGASVWIGNLPAHAVDRLTSHDGVMTVSWGPADLSAARYALVHEFVTALDAFGKGVDSELTTVFRHSRIWTLVTYKCRGDAEKLLESDLQHDAAWTHAQGTVDDVRIAAKQSWLAPPQVDNAHLMPVGAFSCCVVTCARAVYRTRTCLWMPQDVP
jgi:hypothetical protein